MSKYLRASDNGFRKMRVVMKKGIPVFEGYAVAGKLSNVPFSIVCPDKESCEKIWNTFMSVELNHNIAEKVVLCRSSDVEMDVTAAKLRMVKS